jgi:hypothetical protein
MAGSIVAPTLFAQDVMELVDGEKFIGKLVSSSGTSATFKSDLVGQVTVDWSKVKALQSSQSFAVIPKNVELKRNADISKVPEGKISFADQKITVTPADGPPQSVPVSEADRVIEQTAFQNALQHEPGFLSAWGGTATAGASLVEATQQSRTFNVAINLVRTVPDVDWLHRRNRTTVDFTAAYGTLRQPATPLVKTEIFHADGERDEYFSGSIFGFGQAAFDHNFSQGLDLQQAFGGGIGWSVIKRGNESLDLKASVDYVRQNFTQAAATQDLIGSTFEEDFQRGLRRGIKFTEQLIVSPAWNNSSALSATGNTMLTIPVYKRMNFTLGTLDNYLHDPPPGFKKNSFQATMGLTYALR